jgi:hypothetical protein
MATPINDYTDCVDYRAEHARLEQERRTKADSKSSLDEAFNRLPKCEVKPDGTCSKCNGKCMWYGEKDGMANELK